MPSSSTQLPMPPKIFDEKFNKALEEKVISRAIDKTGDVAT